MSRATWFGIIRWRSLLWHGPFEKCEMAEEKHNGVEAENAV